MSGVRILEGYSARTSPNPLPNLPLYPFALDLESLLPGTYRLSIFRSPSSFRSPTIHSLRICCVIDAPRITSEVKVIDSISSTGRLKGITFSVGVIEADGVDAGTVRFYAEGLATSGSHLFDWCLEIERTRTLPRIVLQPVARFGMGLWKASTKPVDYGMKPMIGTGMEMGGKLIRSVTEKKKSKRVHWDETLEIWDGNTGDIGSELSTPRTEDGLPVGILRGRKVTRRNSGFW